MARKTLNHACETIQTQQSPTPFDFWVRLYNLHTRQNSFGAPELSHILQLVQSNLLWRESSHHPVEDMEIAFSLAPVYNAWLLQHVLSYVSWGIYTFTHEMDISTDVPWSKFWISEVWRSGWWRVIASLPPHPLNAYCSVDIFNHFNVCTCIPTCV